MAGRISSRGLPMRRPRSDSPLMKGLSATGWRRILIIMAKLTGLTTLS